MTQIPVEQLIYTRLEAAYSSRHQSGYQVAYASPSLSRTDIQSIETRVQCFKFSADEEPRRLQFFPLGEDRAVITLSRPIHHVQIVGTRRGAFLAHCLIIRHSDFANLQYDPFNVFDGFEFVETAEDIVDKFVRAKAVDSYIVLKPSVTAESNDIHGCLDTPDKDSSFGRMYKLAVMAPQLGERKQTIVIQSADDTEIENLLRAALRLVSGVNRLKLSFSTHTDECRILPGQYWVVGSRSGRNPGFLKFPCDELFSNATVSAGEPLQRPYDRWMGMALGKYKTPEVLRQADFAEKLQQWLAGIEVAFVPDHEAYFAQVAEDFFNVNSDDVKARIALQWDSILPLPVATALAGSLLKETPAFDLFRLSSRGQLPQSGDELLQMLRRCIEQICREGRRPDFERSDWRALRQLAENEADPVLAFWSREFEKPFWRGLISFLNGHRRLLNKMTPAEFRTTARLACHGIPADRLVCRRHLPLLIDLLDLTAMSDDEFISFLTSTENTLPHWERLLQRIGALSAKSAKKLANLAEENFMVDARIADAARSRIPPNAFQLLLNRCFSWISGRNATNASLNPTSNRRS